MQGRRGPVYAVAWSIDGKLLAGASHVKWVRLWDVGSGKELKRLRNSSSAHWITAVAWSFDGKFLASGGTHCRIILWDAKKGERLTKLKGFYHPVFCLQFNPTDAGQLIIGSWDNTVELTAWQTANVSRLSPDIAAIAANSMQWPGLSTAKSLAAAPTKQ